MLCAEGRHKACSFQGRIIVSKTTGACLLSASVPGERKVFLSEYRVFSWLGDVGYFLTECRYDMF